MGNMNHYSVNPIWTLTCFCYLVTPVSMFSFRRVVILKSDSPSPCTANERSNGCMQTLKDYAVHVVAQRYSGCNADPNCLVMPNGGSRMSSKIIGDVVGQQNAERFPNIVMIISLLLFRMLVIGARPNKSFPLCDLVTFDRSIEPLSNQGLRVNRCTKECIVLSSVPRIMG